MRAAAKRLRHVAVDRELFFFGGRGFGFEENKLGAEQTHALGAILNRRPGFFHAADIRHDLNPVPVAGDGRLARGLGGSVAALALFLLGLARGSERARVGLNRQRAGAAVENHLGAGRKLQHAIPGAHHRWQAQRARQNRGVRVRAAHGGAEAQRAWGRATPFRGVRSLATITTG